MDVRPNRAKRMLRAGQPVFAPNLGPGSIPDLDTLDYLGAAGLLDLAWIEMEHGPWTWRELSDASRVCDLWGVTSMVRVQSADVTTIGRVLDRGVQGVMVPHVSTRADAETAVRGAYFAPRGARGLFLSRQAYGTTDYFAQANDETLVVVLIEEVRALENLDEILTVDGIDCFFVAPADLAQTMGPQYLGKPFHPDVQALVKKTIAHITAAGRTAGTIVDDDNLAEYLDLGARLLRVHALPYLERGLRGIRDQARNRVGDRTLKT